MLPATAYLVRLGSSGQPEERYVLIGNGTWLVGRSNQAAIILDSPWVSRLHALIQRRNNEAFYVVDLGSRNGTFVNGRRVTLPVRLRERDEMVFGQVRMQLLLASGGLAGGDAPTTSAIKTRCLMTAVVLHLRNGAILEKQAPDQQVAQVMGTWFRQVGEITQRYGAQVSQYTERGVMVAWFHSPKEPAAADWLRILRAFWSLYRGTSNLHLQYLLPFPLQLGTGVNTGYALVAPGGSPQQTEYVALGQTVSAAFALEAATKTAGYDVLVGEMTYQHLQRVDLADWLEPVPVQLQPQAPPVQVWGSRYDRLRTFLYNYGLAETPTCQQTSMPEQGFV